MRSPKYLSIPIFAGIAAAQQSTIDVFTNLFITNDTLTLQASDATATTYAFTCVPTPSEANSKARRAETTDPNTLPKVSYTSFFSTTIPTELLTLSHLPTVTGLPTTTDNLLGCYNYTLIQGSSTGEFHLTIPEASITDDYNCNWKGEMKTADITCTVTVKGEVFGSQGVETTVVPHSIIEESSLIAPMVVMTTGGSSTPTGAKGESGGASPSATKSAGLAAAGPLPTGFGMAGWAGGAAAVLVAAVAL